MLFSDSYYDSILLPHRENILSEKIGKEPKAKVKRNYIGLYLTSFLSHIAMGSIIIAVPLRAILLDASSLTLGTLGSTPGLTYISLCFLFGKLSERWPRKRMVALGFFVYILASLFLSLSSRIYQIYLSMLLLGIAGAMVWPALEAWIAEKPSKRPLAKKMALFSISWSAGIAVGPLLGGFLFSVSFKLPFYLALFTNIFILFILLWKTPEVTFFAANKAAAGNASLTQDPPLDSPLYVRASRIASFTLSFSLGIIRYIFPKLAIELDISPSSLGFLMFILSLSQMLTFYALGITHRWHYRIFPLISFQFIAIVGFLTVFATGFLPLFFLGFLFIGVGTGMSYSSTLFYSVNVTSQRGPSVAIHETVLASGFFLGPLIGGAVAQRFSLRTPYPLLAALILVGILIQVLIKRHYSLSNKATAQCRSQSN